MTQTKSRLFQPFAFKNGLILRNRAVMAPMTTWSSNPDGTVSDQEVAYYRARVKGVGMVVTGCTHVTPDGIGFTDEFASHDDRFIPSLRRLSEAAKSGGAPAILQIFHAGNKAVPQLVPDGRVVSSSALKVPPGPFNDSEVTSHALTQEEIEEIILAFGKTTRRAIEAGFDGIDMSTWYGLYVTGGTPDATVKQLADELKRVMALPEVKARIRELGGNVLPMYGETFTRFNLAEYVSYKRLITQAKITAE